MGTLPWDSNPVPRCFIGSKHCWVLGTCWVTRRGTLPMVFSWQKGRGGGWGGVHKPQSQNESRRDQTDFRIVIYAS